MTTQIVLTIRQLVIRAFIIVITIIRRWAVCSSSSVHLTLVLVVNLTPELIGLFFVFMACLEYALTIEEQALLVKSISVEGIALIFTARSK